MAISYVRQRFSGFWREWKGFLPPPPARWHILRQLRLPLQEHLTPLLIQARRKIDPVLPPLCPNIGIRLLPAQPECPTNIRSLRMLAFAHGLPRTPRRAVRITCIATPVITHGTIPLSRKERAF
jgi:hypothetical protein